MLLDLVELQTVQIAKSMSKQDPVEKKELYIVRWEPRMILERPRISVPQKQNNDKIKYNQI